MKTKYMAKVNLFSLKNVFIIIIFIITLSCNKKNKNNCIYTIKDHLNNLNDTIKYNEYIDEFGFKVFDERKNGFGGVYYFYKDILHEYIFFERDSLINYFQMYDTTGNLLKTELSPLVCYSYFSDSINRIKLVVNYALINAEIKNLKLEFDTSSKNIGHYKSSENSNVYYSSILLSRHNKKSIIGKKYILKYDLQYCDGQKRNYIDTLLATKVRIE